MATLQRWCQATVVGADGAVLAGCVLAGRGAPDLGAVDEVARLALLAARHEGRVVLAEVSAAMRELLELAGLEVEMEGQSEPRKEPFLIQEGQEEVQPRDLSS